MGACSTSSLCASHMTTRGSDVQTLARSRRRYRLCKVINPLKPSTLVMQLAAALGLGVAPAVYQPETRACLIQRYDRLPDGLGGLRRLHQLDLCQLAGKPSNVKYESDGGPTLLDCRKLLAAAGVGGPDVKRFLQWILFNLMVGNNDSHAKNLSVLLNGDGKYVLAPFYD